MKFRHNRLFTVAALTTAGLLTQAAHASLTINLRFADGTTQHNLTASDVGHDVEVDVWATITGHNAPSDHNFFALNYVYFAVASSLPFGPGGAADGALAINTPDGHTSTPIAPFNAPGGQIGTLQDFNGDGIADVGPISSTGLTDYAKSRAFPTVWSDFNISGKNLLANGVEFELEKLYYHVNSLSGSETDYSPLSVALSPPYYPSIWAYDVPSYTYNAPIGSQYSQSTPALAGSQVQFLVNSTAPQTSDTSVPEPTAGAMLLGLTLLPLRRRRK